MKVWMLYGCEMVMSNTTCFVYFNPPAFQMNFKWCWYYFLALFFSTEPLSHHFWKNFYLAHSFNSMCYFIQALIFLFLTIVFLCLSLAVSDYRQSLQFQNLNKEKQNIQLEVCVEVMKIFYCLFFYLLAFGV